MALESHTMNVAYRRNTLCSLALLCCLGVLLSPRAEGSWLSDTLRRNKIIPGKKIKAVAKTVDRNKQQIDRLTEQRGDGLTPTQPATRVSPTDSDARFVSYYDSALTVVTTLETGRIRGFDDVTPDFDQQGLTVGLLGWNINQQSLQPLVRGVGYSAVIKWMPQYGDQFWKACVSPVPEGLSIVRSWQEIVPGRQARWKPSHENAVRELKRFLVSPPMKAAQVEKSRRTASSALLVASEWAEAVRGEGTYPTLREFTVFYDALVQNGSMKGLTYKHVNDWRNRNRSESPRRIVCQWLERVQPDDYQAGDARKNAKLWLTAFPQQYEALLLLHWLRAQEAYANSFRAQHNALSRRGTILANNGWVNTHQWSFPQLVEQ